MKKVNADDIVTYKQHQFIYGVSKEEKEQLIKSLIDMYPIVYGQDCPSALKLSSPGLKSDIKSERLQNSEEIMAKVAAREYLKNQILYQLLTTIEKNNEIMWKIEPNVSCFLKNIASNKQIDWTMRTYIEKLKQNIGIYLSYYAKLNSKIEARYIQDLPNDVLSIDLFFKELKELLNNNGQINILIDYNEPMIVESAQSIMTIINDRWAGTVCMKVLTDPEIWPTYQDLENHILKFPNDYSIIELDDSYKKVLNKRRLENPKDEDDL